MQKFYNRSLGDEAPTGLVHFILPRWVTGSPQFENTQTLKDPSECSLQVVVARIHVNLRIRWTPPNVLERFQLYRHIRVNAKHAGGF